jgi:hypothetical protein
MANACDYDYNAWVNSRYGLHMQRAILFGHDEDFDLTMSIHDQQWISVRNRAYTMMRCIVLHYGVRSLYNT